MIGFLKGYYGYKNFGDEVLLLGIIPYIFKHYQIDTLLIEAQDVERLQVWLDRHQVILGELHTKLIPIGKHQSFTQKRDVLFLGGGEVLTDGRSFPHNGRNYLLYRKTLLFGQFHLLGGIGTPKGLFSQLLRRFLLGRALSVVTREKRSYAVAHSFREKKDVVLYHDFAEDVLIPLVNQINIEKKSVKKSQALLNVNPYIWSEETKERLVNYSNKFDTQIFFPAERGVDDRYFESLKLTLPELVIYDWTQHDLKSILNTVSISTGVIAARLHVLWLAKLLTIPYEPLVYQEKIQTFLEG